MARSRCCAGTDCCFPSPRSIATRGASPGPSTRPGLENFRRHRPPSRRTGGARASPDQWRAHLTSGDDVVSRAQGAGGLRGVLRSGARPPDDYRSDQPLPPVPVDPFPKDGLAISGGVPLEPIETVSPSSPEWPAMAMSLLKEFNRVEDVTITGVRHSASVASPDPARDTAHPAGAPRVVVPLAVGRTGMDRVVRRSRATVSARSRRQGLRPRDARQRLGAPSGRQAREGDAAAREADLLRPRRRHLHAAVRPHSTQEGHLLGVSALRLGVASRTRSSAVRPKQVRYVLEVAAGGASRAASSPHQMFPSRVHAAAGLSALILITLVVPAVIPARQLAARTYGRSRRRISRRSKGRASGRRSTQDRIPDLRRLQPGYVVIGDSMAGTRLDERRLVELTGVQVAPLLQAGSGPAFWYLALKNWVIASGIKPRMVLIFFRDTNLTDVMFRLDQQFRWALDLAALDREDELNAVVARRLGLLHRVAPLRRRRRRGRAGAPADGAGGDGLARRRDDVVAPPAGGVRHADERAARPRSSAARWRPPTSRPARTPALDFARDVEDRCCR